MSLDDDVGGPTAAAIEAKTKFVRRILASEYDAFREFSLILKPIYISPLKSIFNVQGFAYIR